MKTYEDGLNEAWELARKLVHSVYRGYTDEEKQNIFDSKSSDYILTTMSAAEVKERIRQYQEKNEAWADPVIGDELECRLDDYYCKAVVVITGYDGWQVLVVKDSETVEMGKIPINYLRNWHKTGRNFPQVADLLEAMKEEKEGE